MAKALPKYIVQLICMEVLNGKSKYQVSRELDDNEYAVYNHTCDISSTNKKESTLRKNELFLGKKKQSQKDQKIQDIISDIL